MPQATSPKKQRLTLAQLAAYDDILTDALVDHVSPLLSSRSRPAPDFSGIFLDRHSQEQERIPLVPRYYGSSGHFYPSEMCNSRERPCEGRDGIACATRLAEVFAELEDREREGRLPTTSAQICQHLPAGLPLRGLEYESLHRRDPGGCCDCTEIHEEGGDGEVSLRNPGDHD